MSAQQPPHDPYGYPQLPPYAQQPGQPFPGQPVPGQPLAGQQFPGQPPQPTHSRVNGFGIAALVIGVLSLIGAAIPVINYGSGILALIGLVLGIVGICLKNRKKGMAITGSILSVIAIVLSIVLAITYTSSFINTIIDYAPSPTATHGPDAAGEPGTIQNPIPVGTTAQLGADEPEWGVSIDDVLIDTSDENAKTTAYGADSADGNRYIAINLTVSYLGVGSATPSTDLSVTFVDAEGTEHQASSLNPPGPDTDFDDITGLATGESASGSVVIEVPEDTMNGGLVRVTAGSDECYFGSA